MANLVQMLPTKTTLTPKQSRFIDNLLAGIGTQEQCAVEAGYSRKSAKVEASRLLKNSKVMHVIQEKLKMSLGVRSIKALQTISMLSENANSEYVKLEASKDILDRTGIHNDSVNSTTLNNAIQVNIDLS